ncbi:MAG: ABC transporter permease [Patescibacteria group bacterium]|jgi:putative ABC transport system permease protein|nr:ABC transporter permease [Patescibacteria group bacterium]
MFEELKQLLQIVFRALLSNKTRSFLTMLGIVIGVGAVVLIMSLGAGAQSLILGQLDSFGTDLVGILPGASDEKGPPASVFGIVPTSLKQSDIEALKDKSNVPNLKYIVSYYDINLPVSWKDNNYDTTIKGTSGDFLEVENTEVVKGRFFSSSEMSSALKLAVIGQTVVDEVFIQSNPIGQRMKIDNQTVEVIGVLEEKGKAGFSDPNDQILVPLEFAQKILAGVNYLSSAFVRVDQTNNIDYAISDIKMTLRERHDVNNPEEDDFSVRAFKDALELVTTITNSIKYFLAAMAALSLIVGGVGIMNIMLVSVTERTREIGLRKAIGAKNNHIRLQFLFESIVLTLIGGIIGLLIGIFFAWLVSVVVQSLGYDWAFVISFSSFAIAIGLSTVIGVIFGFYPANRASKLDPIEALRYE